MNWKLLSCIHQNRQRRDNCVAAVDAADLTVYVEPAVYLFNKHSGDAGDFESQSVSPWAKWNSCPGLQIDPALGLV